MEPQETHPGDGAPPAGPPPWITDVVQQRMRWRNGDIVIAVPPKSGTTWTMNIVHQLRSGGDDTFTDVYAEVPWPELVPAPGTDLDDLVARFDAMPDHRRRAFKTHAAAGVVPFHPAGSGIDVQYVVVVRNPEEAVASFRPFIASHSDAWFALWQVPRDALVGPDFATYFAGIASQALVPWIFGFVASWWPLRHEPNVHLVHYADLQNDPERSIRDIAAFLRFDVPEDRWPVVLEHTSFAWMKAHEDRFELRSVTPVPALDPGAMLRKGRLGAAAEDGITPQIGEAIAAIGREILTDPDAFEWTYKGGALRS